MASEQPKRKRGGQPKPPEQRKRNNVTIRMRDNLRDKVERAAAAAGRSMSEQIAHTLAEAFANEARAGSAEINAKLDSLAQTIERLAAVAPSLPQVLRDTFAALAGPPSPAPVQAGPPSPAAVQAGPPSPAAVQAGPPSPAPVQAGSPSPAPVQAGSPSPAPVQAGSPSPTPVQAGPPSPAAVQAGPPSSAQALRNALAAGPPSMKEMFAAIAPPPPEPYPEPLRLVVHYSPPARWAETPVITINNKRDSDAA